MKALTLTALILVCLIGAKYPKDTSPGAKQTSKPGDTAFLLKEVGKDYRHIIYVEKNRQSIFYTKLLDFKMDQSDTNAYIQNCRAFDEDLRKPVKKFRLWGLARQWLPVYKYKGKYYLYYPGDTGVENRKMITDSTICYSNMDGWLPEQMLSVKQSDNKTWVFGMSSFGKAKSTLTIHIIDNKTKLAVWEDDNRSAAYRYGLYVPRDYAAKFDMVVNYTNGDLPDEFEFDKIDFKALLKGR
jgi:hypothetical protein